MAEWCPYGLGTPTNTALFIENLKFPTRKGERFFQGVKGFQIKFLELNILYSGINHLPDRHL